MSRLRAILKAGPARIVLATSIALVFQLGAPDSARADLFSLYVEAHGGANEGVGVSGDQKDQAFHKGAGLMTFGALVGAEIFMIDGWIEHNQFRVDGQTHGTWTQFMTGIDFRVDLGSDQRGVTVRKFSPYYAEFGVAIGFGLGTGQQVELPLDNGEVTDKGFVAQGSALFGLRITPTFSLGLKLPLQFGYLFKSGAGASSNDQSNHYQSGQGALLLHLRADLGL